MKKSIELKKFLQNFNSIDLHHIIGQGIQKLKFSFPNDSKEYIVVAMEYNHGFNCYAIYLLDSYMNYTKVWCKDFNIIHNKLDKPSTYIISIDPFEFNTNVA